MADIDEETVIERLQAPTRQTAQEAANRWFSAATDILLREGDAHEYDVFPVAQSGQPPQWDAADGAFVMAWPHVAAPYFEHGTTAHEVEGDPILAFEWEAMRGEEFADTGKTFEEVFDTFPTVFLPSVTVDGIPALHWVSRGRQQAAQWLRQRE